MLRESLQLPSFFKCTGFKIDLGTASATGLMPPSPAEHSNVLFLHGYSFCPCGERDVLMSASPLRQFCFTADTVGVEQIASVLRNLKTARAIKLNRKVEEMYTQSKPTTRFLPARLAQPRSDVFNWCELMFYLTAHHLCLVWVGWESGLLPGLQSQENTGGNPHFPELSILFKNCWALMIHVETICSSIFARAGSSLLPLWQS